MCDIYFQVFDLVFSPLISDPPVLILVFFCWSVPCLINNSRWTQNDAAGQRKRQQHVLALGKNIPWFLYLLRNSRKFFVTRKKQNLFIILLLTFVHEDSHDPQLLYAKHFYRGISIWIKNQTKRVFSSIEIYAFWTYAYHQDGYIHTAFPYCPWHN